MHSGPYISGTGVFNMFGLTAFQDILNVTNSTDHPEELSPALVPSLSMQCCCVQRMSVCRNAGLYTHTHLAQVQETETVLSCIDLPKDFFLVNVLPFLQKSLEQQ